MRLCGCATKLISLLLAILYPILKKKAELEFRVEQDAPVNLISAVYKFIKRLLEIELVDYLQSHSIIHASQHGVAPKQICFSNLLVLEQWVTALLDDKKDALVVYLGFPNMFGSVNHRLYGCKLKGDGVRPQLIF